MEEREFRVQGSGFRVQGKMLKRHTRDAYFTHARAHTHARTRARTIICRQERQSYVDKSGSDECLPDARAHTIVCRQERQSYVDKSGSDEWLPEGLPECLPSNHRGCMAVIDYISFMILPGGLPACLPNNHCMLHYACASYVLEYIFCII